ncbi:MAG: hypothetical protein JOY71_04915 [Acetobacteraceae bacterium]|nr:hypothetical protein [Acetobacteraceae bacterium]MBV8521462.1 hypothetical protein [Acetobacteraceae bacterium]MBV8590131.1 hypothetical protein [Acetobacteraceae bacterium]
MSGQDALGAVDQALSKKPHADTHDFSAAVRELARFREEVIQSEGTGERLSQLNAVISVVIGGHYPLGPVPWPHLEKARELLAKIVQGSDA